MQCIRKFILLTREEVEADFRARCKEPKVTSREPVSNTAIGTVSHNK